MRITQQSLQQNLLGGLRGRLQSLSRAQQEAVTGRRVRSVSDDPIDASQIMRLEGQVRDVEQYRRNGTFATAKLSAEDVALSSAQKVMRRARELALTAANAGPGDPTRQAAVDALTQMREELLALANTQIGGEYLFGGAQTTRAPFTAAGVYVGDQTLRTADLDLGVSVTLNHPGDPLFADAIAAIDGVLAQIPAGTSDQIQIAARGVEAANQVFLRAQAENGARQQDVLETAARLGRQAASLLDQRDALRDVDPAESAIRLTSEQNALERAYAVIGRILQSSLNDFLR